MIKIGFAPEFFRKLKRIHPDIQEEAFHRINLFKNPKNHQFLKVHKLKGRMKNKYAFTITYKIRIIFQWLSKSKNHAYISTIDDHDIYR